MLDQLSVPRACGTCDFGVESILPGSLQKVIQCRRYPPNPVAAPQQLGGGQMGVQIQPHFPMLGVDLYCGEWRKK